MNFFVVLFCLVLQARLFAQENLENATLTDLKDYKQLHRVFHDDVGSVRLLALLSPT